MHILHSVIRRIYIHNNIMVSYRTYDMVSYVPYDTRCIPYIVHMVQSFNMRSSNYVSLRE